MAVIYWPGDLRQQPAVICAICKQSVHISEVSAGAYDSSGHQAFACDKHFQSNSELIVGWTDFSVRQLPPNNAAVRNRLTAPANEAPHAY